MRNYKNTNLILTILLITVVLLLYFKLYMANKIVSVEFEVFGKVQGVFFRKYTQQKGKELGLNGWCRNTKNYTVEGALQGDPEKIEEMKRWLQTVGSPSSKIEKAVFKNEKTLSSYSFKNFEIRR